MHRLAVFALAVSFAALPYASLSQGSHDKKKHEKPPAEKNIWNFDGGIFFQSDGGLADGPCFRISGRVFAPDFFQDLKRFDYEEVDSVFRRGKDTVTQFPEQMRLEFSIHDLPCSLKLDELQARGYLTRPEIETLRVELYWKRGVGLRPVELVSRPQLFVHLRPGPAYAAAEGLKSKFEWFYVYNVVSAGIPVTDSLVVLLRTPDGHIAARVAARM
jgi:hypothetical protein